MEPNIRYCCSEFRSSRRDNAIFIISDPVHGEQYVYGPNIPIRFCPHCGKILPEDPF